jgi:hypothetical protein
MNINTYPLGQISIDKSIIPIGNNGTHFSHAGVGGYVEVPTLKDMYDIPSISEDPNNTIDPNGLTSGKRKLGMIVHVLENDKYYQLKPRYKDTEKIISWPVLSGIPDLFRGFLMNPSRISYLDDSTLSIAWSNIEALTGNHNITVDDINSLKKYGYLPDPVGDPFGLVDGILIGTGDASIPLNYIGEIPQDSQAWTEIFVKGWEEKTNEFAPAVIQPYSPKRPIYFIADNISSVPNQESDFNILSEDFNLSDGSVFGIQVGINAKRIVIAYPALYGDLTRVIDSSTGFNIIGSFNKTTISKNPPLSTDFTPPNTDYNGLTNVDYNIYTSVLAVSYSSPTVYTVTI